MSQKSIPTIWAVIAILMVLAVIGVIYYRHLAGGPTIQRIQPPPGYFSGTPGK